MWQIVPIKGIVCRLGNSNADRRSGEKRLQWELLIEIDNGAHVRKEKGFTVGWKMRKLLDFHSSKVERTYGFGFKAMK